MSSRAIKKSRLEKRGDGEKKNDALCIICNVSIGIDKVECLLCSASVHADCLKDYNMEWEIYSEGTAMCKQCSSINRLAQTD